MYIEPNTTIKILKNVPLDGTYDHTIYFTDATAQANYFASKVKYNLDRQSYQRVQRGWMRIMVQAENLYDCNYIMFQNTAFGNKWFYAFLKSVEYVNHNVSQVEFEIDVMQTWFFDYQLDDCFVEREHTATDVIGEHTVPENLEIGQYEYVDQGQELHFTNYQIVVAATFDEQLNDATGGKYGGIYTGLHYNAFLSVNDVNQFISDAVAANKADGIVAVFMVPTSFVNFSQQTPLDYNTAILKNYSWTYNRGGKTGPRNKKLYTYPFNLLYVTNLDGNSAEFRFEFFENWSQSIDNCGFTLNCVLSCSPEAGLYPRKYKGVEHNYNERMTVANFPQCAYNTDAFKAWLAQNKARLIVDTASTVANTAIGVATAKKSEQKVTAIAGGVEQVASTLAQVYTASTMPPQARGVSTNTLNLATDTQGFHFYYAKIRDEYAAIVDDYFDRFGYAIHRNKVPNRNVRPHWCYTKTIGCTITGSIPADDARAICNIYNNGITFWKNGNEVGDYSLDNRV